MPSHRPAFRSRAPLSREGEEAHRYIPADERVGFAATARAITRIATEGRKYRVSLALISQRPSELSPQALSQCGTIFALRRGNDLDQRCVATALPDASRGLLAALPSMCTQEAAEYVRSVRGFGNTALATLNDYPWPGNVRELENRVKRAVVMSYSSLLSAVDLGLAASGQKSQSLGIREARAPCRARSAPIGSRPSPLQSVQGGKTARDKSAHALRSDVAAPDRPRCVTITCG